MNIKRIIREEIDDFDWVRDIPTREVYKISSEPNLYIDDSIVSSLDLPKTDNLSLEKILGKFKWTSGGTNYEFTARLYPLDYASGKKMWRVAGTSGDYGFGYSFITKKNILGRRARMQIFKQIIDRYNLDKLI